MQAKLCVRRCALRLARVLHGLCGLSVAHTQCRIFSRLCKTISCDFSRRHGSRRVIGALSYEPSRHLCHVAVRLQVAGFMNDRLIVEHSTSALGSMCLARDPSDSASAAPEALVTAVLALPQHLLQVVTASPLGIHELPQLLEMLPAALHRALLATAVQTPISDTAVERKADAERDGAPVHCVAHDTSAEADSKGATNAGSRCLQLRRASFSDVASAALLAHIQQLPPLDAVICHAALSMPALAHALASHASVTRLDLSGAAVACTKDSARALANALPSWPHLRSLWLDHRTDERHVPDAAASDILAPALARASALTSINLSRMRITVELARAVGALAQLAELRAHACTGVERMAPHLAALSHLRLIHARRACRGDDPRPEYDMRIRRQFERGLSACMVLNHLDLVDTYIYDGNVLEPAALTQLESLRLWPFELPTVHSAPFAADSPACRFGLRSLPHLQLLTELSITGIPGTDAEAHVLGDLLPRLPRLARLELARCESVAGERARAEGWHARRRCAHSLATFHGRCCSCATHSPPRRGCVISPLCISPYRVTKRRGRY